jgi:hypothetical protein
MVCFSKILALIRIRLGSTVITHNTAGFDPKDPVQKSIITALLHPSFFS